MRTFTWRTGNSHTIAYFHVKRNFFKSTFFRSTIFEWANLDSIEYGLLKIFQNNHFELYQINCEKCNSLTDYTFILSHLRELKVKHSFIETWNSIVFVVLMLRFSLFPTLSLQFSISGNCCKVMKGYWKFPFISHVTLGRRPHLSRLNENETREIQWLHYSYSKWRNSLLLKYSVNRARSYSLRKFTKYHHLKHCFKTT